MSKLSGQCLAVFHHRLKVEKAAECLAFYTDKFGMKLVAQVENDREHVYMLSFVRFYGNETQKYNKYATYLELVAPKLKPQNVKLLNHGDKEGVYWKIGVHLPDVNAAVTNLQQLGVSVSPGNQFRDIGFLTHLTDPDKYTIELLQMTFEGHIAHESVPEHPLNQQPVFGLITLRISDIEQSLKFYRDILGMKLLCRMDVSVYGFVLYFLAFTTDTPPSEDLDAIENREWLYQRSYTTIELQVFEHKQQHKYKQPDENTYGFIGMGFGCKDIKSLRKYLEESHGLKTYDHREKHEIFDAPSLIVKDPDNIPIRVIQYE